MEGTFFYAFAFNQDISHWDTTQVTSMNRMFLAASAFQHDLRMWCVGNVFDGDYFDYAHTAGIYNPPDFGHCGAKLARSSDSSGLPYILLDIETSAPNQVVCFPLAKAQVVNMLVDFGDGTSPYVVFNNQSTCRTPAIPGISHLFVTPGAYRVRLAGRLDQFGAGDGATGFAWGDVLRQVSFSGNMGLTSLAGAFVGSSVNLDISSVPCGLLDISWAFFQATAFDRDISGWDVSRVTSFSGTFQYALVFNHNLNSWDTSSARSMDWMFYDAITFNQPVSSWDTSRVTTMYAMFGRAVGTCQAFQQDVTGWCVSNVIDAGGFDASHCTGIPPPPFTTTTNCPKASRSKPSCTYGTPSALSLILTPPACNVVPDLSAESLIQNASCGNRTYPFPPFGRRPTVSQPPFVAPAPTAQVPIQTIEDIATSVSVQLATSNNSASPSTITLVHNNPSICDWGVSCVYNSMLVVQSIQCTPSFVVCPFWVTPSATATKYSVAIMLNLTVLVPVPGQFVSLPYVDPFTASGTTISWSPSTLPQSVVFNVWALNPLRQSLYLLTIQNTISANGSLGSVSLAQVPSGTYLVSAASSASGVFQTHYVSGVYNYTTSSYSCDGADLVCSIPTAPPAGLSGLATLMRRFLETDTDGCHISWFPPTLHWSVDCRRWSQCDTWYATARALYFYKYGMLGTSLVVARNNVVGRSSVVSAWTWGDGHYGSFDGLSFDNQVRSTFLKIHIAFS
jgi:surface protein